MHANKKERKKDTKREERKKEKREGNTSDTKKSIYHISINEAKYGRARRARSEKNLRARQQKCGPRARGPALRSGLLIELGKGLIELGRGLIELGIGLIELGMV